MSSTSSPSMTLNDAAERANVHYQTAYRWVRDGRLPASMVDGSYRVLVSDLEALLDAKAAPAPKRPPSLERVQRLEPRMLDALLTGDEPTARKIGRQLADEGLGMVDLIEGVLVPPLIEIGRRWHEGQLSISVEHRASAIVERLLGDVSPNPRGRRRGTVVVAAVSGDRHSLPTAMAAVVLRERNWIVHQLGADLPVEALLEFCRDHEEIDVVVLSSTAPDRIEATKEAAVEIEQLGVSTLVGQPGATLGDLIDQVDRAAGRTSAA
ncbi:MAG: B12-binding domain-containing protein [Actinomycetota bacterium]